MTDRVLLASIARHIYIKKGTGIGALNKFYGGRNRRRGHRPEKHSDASGSVNRKAVQALEKMKILESDKRGYRSFFSLSIVPAHLPLCSGRKVTTLGQRELDRIANQINTL